MNIYDIAKKADVSIATVSRVLNGSPKVNKATRDKVMSIIENNKYVPSAMAQNLSMQNSFKNIGIVCYNFEDIFYARAVSLLEYPLRQLGYNILLASTGSNTEEKTKSVELLTSKQIDAIILIGSVFVDEKDNNAYIKSISEKIPVIIINGKIKSETIYSLYCDDRTAVKNAVDKLCEFTQNIIFLYDADTYSGNMKIAGFNQGLQEKGISTDNRVIKCGTSPTLAAKAFKDYIAAGNTVNAVITANDIIAAGVVNAAASLHIDIPNDLKIIGYNNSIITQCTNPTLSSIDNKIETICETAVMLLTNIFNGERCENTQQFDAELTLRNSFKG